MLDTFTSLLKKFDASEIKLNVFRIETTCLHVKLLTLQIDENTFCLRMFFSFLYFYIKKKLYSVCLNENKNFVLFEKKK